MARSSKANSTPISTPSTFPTTGPIPAAHALNGCVERYQRTLSEEFIQVHQNWSASHRNSSITSPTLWFYNAERIHSALGQQIPRAFLLSQGQLSRMSVTYTGY